MFQASRSSGCFQGGVEWRKMIYWRVSHEKITKNRMMTVTILTKKVCYFSLHILQLLINKRGSVCRKCNHDFLAVLNYMYVCNKILYILKFSESHYFNVFHVITANFFQKHFIFSYRFSIILRPLSSSKLPCFRYTFIVSSTEK